MAVIQNGNNTAGLQNVDTTYAARVNTNQATQRLGGETPQPNFVGAMRPFHEVDAGSLTGTPLLRSPLVSQDGHIEISRNTLHFHSMFTATTQNTNVWKYTSATQTATQASGYLALNNGLTATITTGVSMSSWKYFGLQDGATMQLTMAIQITSALLSGQTIEIGLFLPTQTTAPADGAYFRVSSSAILGCVNYAGVETTVNLPTTLTAATNTDFVIVVGEKVVEFYILGAYAGSITIPVAQPNAFSSQALPITLQHRNATALTGTVSTPRFSCISLYQKDIDMVKPWAHTMASNGCHSSEGTDGNTMGTTALYSNNLAAGAGAAMTNTTAALGTGLGGQFAALPTLVVGTDGIVCSYLNPTGSAAIPPKVLYITGIRIQGAVTTILAGGPVLYAYSLAYGHSALSLTTAQAGSFVSPTTKAATRIALGYENFIVTAPVGTIGGGVFVPFQSPIVVNPGEYIALCAKNFGVVTTTGVITFLVTLEGYQE